MTSIPPHINGLPPLVQPAVGQDSGMPVASGEHFHHEAVPANTTANNMIDQRGIHSQYHKLLDMLSRKPAHASHAFPFEVNGYNNMALGNDWMTLNNAQEKAKGPFKKATNKVSNLYHLSVETAGNIVRDSFWGGIFGTATGLLISAIRFRWGIPEMMNKQKFLGLLMMPGLPILGGLIGAIHGFITSTKRQALQINEAFHTLLNFD